MRIGVERVNHGMAAKPIEIMLLALLVATFASSCKRDSQTEKPESPKQPTTTKSDFLSFMHEGHAAAARWDQPGATAAFRKALDADPTSTPARLNLGLAQLLDSNAEDAVATLKPLLDRPPVSTQMEYLYGLSLLKAGKPEDAIEHLRRASDAAPHESSVLFQYGVALLESKKSEEAAAVLRNVIDLDRFHITAPFRLARIERAAGRTEEADRWMLKSEQNRAILGTDASDREARGLNRFTKPLDPPLGWEPKEKGKSVRYVDLQDPFQSEINFVALGSLVAVIGRTGNGAPEFLAHSKDSWKVVHFSGGKLNEIESSIEDLPVAYISDVSVGDFDNDGFTDVFIVGTPHATFLRQQANHRFTNDTNQAGLGDIMASQSCAMDIDHDGDLDLLIALYDQKLSYFQNDGKGNFTDLSALLALPDSWATGSKGRIATVSIGDVNDDDSTDLLATFGNAASLLQNRGSYDFRTVFGSEIPSTVLSDLDDLNNDGQLEAAYVVCDESICAKGHIAFTDQNVKQIEFHDMPAPSLNLLDYDSDGFVDVLLSNQNNFHLWRNRGTHGWNEVTGETGLDSIIPITTSSELVPPRIRVQDVDGDGDTDIIIEEIGGSMRILRADSNERAKALNLSLEGTKSNRSGIGARVDIRAGSARIFRNITSQPITIGVGDFEKLDLVKILWPNGATDAFTNVPVDKPLHVVETTVTLGSCPHLYVWDNDQFRFVTDILGNAPLGLPYAPGKYLAADTSEIVWLGNEQNVSFVEPHQSPERKRGVAGARIPSRTNASGNPFPPNMPADPKHDTSSFRHSIFDIRHSAEPVARASDSEESQRLVTIEITDELRELLYLDDVKLLVVDHPNDVEVHPNDKVIPPPFPNSEVWSVRNARPPIHAVNDAGQDVSSSLTAVDNIKVGPRKLRSPQLKGLAETTSLTLDFGPIDTTKPNTLVMNGWLHWGGASSNIAAAQNPTLGNPFPRLEAMTGDGTWQPVDVVVGAPSGKTKTILVNLTNKLPADTKQLRLTWGLEVFWDRIALAERLENPISQEETPPPSWTEGDQNGSPTDRGEGLKTSTSKMVEIAPTSANLYYRGVPRMTRSSPDQPFIPDYNDLLESPPWRMIPQGFCTRVGDVLELLTATDDRYVIMNCGDACRIEFDVTTLPPVADGWSRDFFLYTDGWDKDMDHNVFTGHTVLPLPVHGQDEQRYGLEQFELPSTDWIEKYNKRWVAGQLNE